MKSPKKVTKSAPVKDTTGLRTINDLMMSVELEIDSLKDGSLSEARARVIAKNRDIQLRAFELVLNAAKLEAKLRPELTRRLGLPPISPTVDAKILQ